MLKKDLEFLKKVDYTPNLKKKYTYIEGDFHKVSLQICKIIFKSLKPLSYDLIIL